jgi:hypothetical protein
VGTFANGPVRSKASGPSAVARPSVAAAGPAPFEHPILHLQRTVGNQAVLRMLRARRAESKAGLTAAESPRFGPDLTRPPIHPPAPAVIQKKLAINPPGDRYEQEADQVAEQVMRMPTPVDAAPMTLTAPVSLQPKCDCRGTCDKCQANRNGDDHNHYERLPLSSADSSRLDQAPAPPIVEEVLRSPGRPLDTATRAFMEPRFGRDFSDVRIQTGSRAEESARAVNALAYAAGRNVVFGSGQYTPGTGKGNRLLAHELAHVVQQGFDATAIHRSPAIGQKASRDEKLARQHAYRIVTRIKNHGKLSTDVRKIINRDLAYFEDSAKAVYIHEIKGVLSSVVEIEMPGMEPPTGAAPNVLPPRSWTDAIDPDNLSLDDELPNCEPHVIGESWGSSMLLDIVISGSPARTGLRIYDFETGQAQEFDCNDWLARAGIRQLRPSTELERIAKQLSKPQIRSLWPDAWGNLLKIYEAGKVALDDNLVLSTYKGMIKAQAGNLLNENEKEIDSVLDSSGQLDHLKDFASEYKAAAEVHDRLKIEVQAEEKRIQPMYDSLTDGIARTSQRDEGYLANLYDARDALTRHKSDLEGVIGFWESSFPLLKRLKTNELYPAKIEATLREIKTNIQESRRRLETGELDVWDLAPIREQIKPKLGRRTTEVIHDEEKSKSRWSWVKSGALTVGMIALAFIPGGAYLDYAIGFAMAADSWLDAEKVGKAARTSLDPDEGLISQAQASGARFAAIVSTILAAAGPLASSFRGLRVARNYFQLAEAFPALETGERFAAARALLGKPGVLKALVAGSGDEVTLARIRAALRAAGDNPKALTNALTDAGEQVSKPAEEGFRRRIFAQKNAPIADPNLPPGEGVTDKFGNITYSSAGSATDRALVLYHELVHSVLSPRLNFLRTMRADFGMFGYRKSGFLKYLEEALAETYAQVRVHGMRGVFTGIRFPIKENYVSLSRVVTEAAIGTVVYGGTVYGVYISASKDSDSATP